MAEAQASPQDIMAKLAQISQNDINAGVAATIIQQNERMYSPACKELGQYTPVAITVFEEPTFDGQHTIRGGAWKIAYQVVACSRVVVRNLLYTATKEGAVAITAMAPGTSLADVRLQSDTQTSLMGSILASNKEYKTCKDPFVIDTEVMNVPITPDAAWKERWTVNVCGAREQREVDFVPNAKGVLLSINPML